MIKELYSFYSVMKQLEEKYNVAWPFIPYDPDRVPLLLRNVTPEERRIAAIQAQAQAQEPDSSLSDDASMEALGLRQKDEGGGESKHGDLCFDESPPISPRREVSVPHTGPYRPG